jgi:hypothetical protein
VALRVQMNEDDENCDAAINSEEQIAMDHVGNNEPLNQNTEQLVRKEPASKLVLY